MLRERDCMKDTGAATRWSSIYRPQRKVPLEDIAQGIRETVSMDDAVSLYAPEHPPRGRRIPCPIHHGKDYNLSFTAHGYRCFVCGAAGDVIGFVKDVCELSTRPDAMRRINRDFHLGLPIEGEATFQFSAEAARRRLEAQKRQRAISEWEERYNDLWDEWARLDAQIQALSISDTWEAAERAKAIERRETVEYLIDGLPEKPG